jgi:hypothetical protein
MHDAVFYAVEYVVLLGVVLAATYLWTVAVGFLHNSGY